MNSEQKQLYDSSPRTKQTQGMEQKEKNSSSAKNTVPCLREGIVFDV